jgi:photosystem II stability/assembly factor-like uncharacterized protein
LKYAFRMAGMLVCACLMLPGAFAADFQDPLDFPAAKMSRVAQRPMQAVARAGSSLIAVGSRGLIVVSPDLGKSWTQVPSPVQSDLVALHFPSALSGWAVGHDGVVLHSANGGASWSRQFDGRMAKVAFTRHYAGGDDKAQRAVEQNYKAGAALPLLGVWFDDEQHGFAVGAFGLLIATSDGGTSWTPWLEKIDNPEQLSLNAITGSAGNIFIVAERGVIFRLDRAAGRFIRTNSGYEGSFFGVVADQHSVLAYGLRGAIYRSADAGVSWARMATPVVATISAGARLAGSGGFVLASQAGELLKVDANGAHSMYHASHPQRFTSALHSADGVLLLSSLEGLQRESIK